MSFVINLEEMEIKEEADQNWSGATSYEVIAEFGCRIWRINMQSI